MTDKIKVEGYVVAFNKYTGRYSVVDISTPEYRVVESAWTQEEAVAWAKKRAFMSLRAPSLMVQ